MTHATVIKAAIFAERMHRGQTRKDAKKTPYIAHPLDVAQFVALEVEAGNQEVVAAALLHDTIEDTGTSYNDLVDEFGSSVADLVSEVSDNKSLPKDARKQAQIDHAASLSEGAALIKLADKMCNVGDVVSNPPPDWNPVRRMRYLIWARQVIDQCSHIPYHLRERFGSLVTHGLEAILEIHEPNIKQRISYDYSQILGINSKYRLDSRGNREIQLCDYQPPQKEYGASIYEEGAGFGKVDSICLNEADYSGAQDVEYITRTQLSDMGDFTFEDICDYLLKDVTPTTNFTSRLHEFLESREILYDYFPWYSTFD